MPNVFKEGDRVQVVDREATAADVKSNLFYNHYRGLVGTVQKVFETTVDVAVTVDEDSLPEAIGTRHQDIRQAMKTKWLDGLSEEARNRLSEQEKDFNLRYTILIAPVDLLPSNKPLAVHTPTAAIEAAPAPETAVSQPGSPRRKTAAEIEAAEEEYLRSRKLENA
jgi:ribosomal protein L21E